MRLSDIKGERCLEVIADLIEPMTSIARDQRVARFFTAEEVPEGGTAEDLAAAKLADLAPVLLKEHKRDVIAILAALEGVGAEEYAEQLDMAKLIKGVTELLTDEALLAFLS